MFVTERALRDFDMGKGIRARSTRALTKFGAWQMVRLPQKCIFGSSRRTLVLVTKFRNCVLKSINITIS